MRNGAQGLGIVALLLLWAGAHACPPPVRQALAQTLAVSWICGTLALTLYFYEWESRP